MNSKEKNKLIRDIEILQMRLEDIKSQEHPDYKECGKILADIEKISFTISYMK